MTKLINKHGRKDMPIAAGVLDYFPAALAEIANLSKVGNEQHNKGEPMHWAREKSTDHADCLVRHLIDRGTFDDDGARHTAKLAWRALALLQEELERDARADGREGEWKELINKLPHGPQGPTPPPPPPPSQYPGFSQIPIDRYRGEI